MEFFLDTANIEDIQKFTNLGIISGVTTNPSLLAKEGIKKINLKSHIQKIVALVNGPISVEVYAIDFENMVKEAVEYRECGENIVIKLPCTEDGIRACKKLNSDGYRVNVTLVFSALQALLAAKAGAEFVSPFIGRLEDAGQDGIRLIEDIRTIFDNYEISTKILSASFRNLDEVKQVALIGSDVATVSPAILSKIIDNIFTKQGLQDFINSSK
jgi:transaldolase